MKGSVKEEESSGSPSLLEKLLEAGAESIRVVSPDGIFLSVTNGADGVSEFKLPDGLAGNNWLDSWADASQKDLAMTAIEAARVSGSGRFLGRSRGSRGENQWLDVVVTPLAPGELRSDFLVISKDVTQLKVDNLRIKNLQLLTSALAQKVNLPDVTEMLLDQSILITGADSGLVLRHEPDAEYLTVLGSRNYPDFLVQQWQSCSPSRMLPVPEALRTGAPIYLESISEIVTKYPEMKGVVEATGLSSFVAIPLVVKGSPVAALGLAFDRERSILRDEREYLELIARQCALGLDRAILNEQLEEERAALKNAVVAREDFLSIASHELKTPLTTLKLLADLQVRNLAKKRLDQGDHERVEKFARQVFKQANRIDKLVNDILDFSRMRTGQFSLDSKEVDLSDLVSEIAANLQSRFREAGFPDLELNVPAQLNLNCDRDRIEQVITNLLTNALRYGSQKTVRISLRVDGGFVELSVKDLGIGIPAETIGRIFQKFERDIATKDVTGLGLGLYITQQIVEAHGGSIRVESEVGVGSDFRISLPLKTY